MRHLTHHVTSSSPFRTIDNRDGRSPVWVVLRNLFPVVVMFAVAFGIDQATGQRFSAVWGSLAIAGSVIAVVPRIRPAILALGGYAMIWLVFNLGRAVADNAGLAQAGQFSVSEIETTVFGGTLPSAWLQERFQADGQPGWLDTTLTLVHASFFVVPFVVAVAMWSRQRADFGRYCLATAITFGLGLVGFVLLPTAPPWLTTPDSIHRITLGALFPGNSDLASGNELAFEPNHIAAMPSIHVAAAVLVYLVLRSRSWRWALAGVTYALTMTLAVVYLGEHFLADAVAGWIVALVGWFAAPWLMHRVPAPAILGRQS